MRSFQGSWVQTASRACADGAVGVLSIVTMGKTVRTRSFDRRGMENEPVSRTDSELLPVAKQRAAHDDLSHPNRIGKILRRGHAAFFQRGLDAAVQGQCEVRRILCDLIEMLKILDVVETGGNDGAGCRGGCHERVRRSSRDSGPGT